MLMVSFVVQKLLHLIRSYWFIFTLISIDLRDRSINIAIIYVKECYASVFLQEFYSFWYYIHVFNPFEFLLLYTVLRECSNFILLHVAVQFSLHYLSFLYCVLLSPLSWVN